MNTRSFKHAPSTTRRRTLISGAALALAATLSPLGALAQTDAYPSKPIHIVAPFPPGGIVDNVTRKLGLTLTEKLGQPIVVENKAGAGGSIGAAQVARAKPDGYMLLNAFDTHAVNPLLYKLTFDSEKDLRPIALIATSPLVLVVHPSVPVNTLQELVALSKAQPELLNYASTGKGSSNHLTMELFKNMTGASMLHVPYKGGAPAITDVVGGQVQVMFVSVTSVLGHIRSGRMRPLAVTTAERIPLLPEVPTVSDTYTGFEVQSWLGLLAPSAVPDAIIQTLNTQVNDALKSEDFKSFLDAQSLIPAGGTPEQFGTFMKAETQRWADIIKSQNIAVE